MLKTIVCPISITVPRKTKADKIYYLNLNGYRNWHFIISNDLKKRFELIIMPQLDGLKINNINSISYQLYFKDKRVRDKMNYIAVIDKFFMDTLVSYKCLEDDNDKFTGEVIIHTPIINKEVVGCGITIDFE